MHVCVLTCLCVYLYLQEKLTEDQRKPAEVAPAGAGAGAGAGAKTVGGKYVPPSLRDGANKGKGESMSTQRKGWCLLIVMGHHAVSSSFWSLFITYTQQTCTCKHRIICNAEQ